MKRKSIYALAVVAAAVFTALRVWQYIWIIDISSGFFATVDTTVYLLYGGLAVFLILAVLATFLDKTIAHAHTAFLNSRLTGAALVLCGGMNLFASAYQLTGIVNGSSIVLSTASESLLGLAASLVLLYFGTQALLGRGIRHKFLPLIPVVWVVVRLLNEFRRTSTVLPISENVLSLLCLTVLCIYFMYFAFAAAGLFTKPGARWMFLSAVTGVVLLVPHALGMLIAASANAFFDLEPAWYISRLSMLSFALPMLCTAYFSAFDTHAPAPGNASPPPQPQPDSNASAE